MANTNEISQIDAINKGLTQLNTTLNATAANYLTLVKTIESGNAVIKETAKTEEDLGKAKKKTIDATKEQDALNKQLAASAEKLKTFDAQVYEQIQKNTKALADQKRVVNDKLKADGLAETSLVKMRQRLKELTDQYDRAGVRTKAATTEINNLSKSIAKAEEATNRHGREVGNYSKSLDKFKGVISTLPGPLGSAMGAAEGLVTKLGAFGPIGMAVGGAIMAIGTPLVAFFTKSEKGAEMLERKFAGVKAAISVVAGELIGIGDKMTEALDKPAQSTFWTKVALFFGGPGAAILGAKMDMASTAAEGYTKKLQEMEDAERALIVPRAQANLKIKEAMLMYNDDTKSIPVRLNGLKEAIKLENETADVEIAAQGKQVENLKVINEEKRKAGQLRDSDDLKLQNAIAKQIELQTESAGRQIRATARIRTATEELNKTAAEDAKKVADEKIKQEERAAYATTGLQEMTAKDTLVIKEDGLKSNQDFLDAKLKQAEEEAEKEKQLQEDLKQAKIDLVVEAGNAIFDLRKQAFENELSTLDKEREAALSNKSLTEKQKEKINADFDKKAAAIKTKQAKVEKEQALFNIAIGTAVSIMNAKGNIPLMVLLGIMGAIQAAVVIAKPIPKFAKGTSNAPGAGIFGEAGRELMLLRSGEVGLADKATYFEGGKFKGAKIFSNPETERIIGASDRSINGQAIDSRVIAGLEKLNTTIKNKPVGIFNKEYKQIGLQYSNHQEIYLNRLTKHGIS